MEVNNRKLFNIEETLVRFGGDEELLKELATMFIKDSAFSKEEFENLLKNDDKALCASYVHKLKGSCGTLGCEILYDQCVKVEGILKGKTEGELQQETEILCRIYDKTVSELKYWLGEV
jgi:HPt (histidine-containing phosphotransfer) domain-containing protein